MNILITGVSSGLGKSLKDEYLSNGHDVYGLSRTRVTDCNHIVFDLNNSNPKKYEDALLDLLNPKSYAYSPTTNFDLVILNAGILGEIKTFDKINIGELKKIMNINVFSNKLILDALYKIGVTIKQVVSISSGASEKTYKGWGGYSISKSAMRMMMSVYSKDVSSTHFTSLSPGLVSTQMQDYLCEKVSLEEFPSTTKFIESRDNGTTRNPNNVAHDIKKIVPNLLKMESRGYMDLRNI